MAEVPAESADLNVQFLNASDKMNMQSVQVISDLQETLQPYESWVVHVSILGDNREAFTLFFPILAGLRNELGARALWAAILVEWSNLILKWMFRGDRPYWWVGETPLYNGETRPFLRQFPNTCESGPGTPSGHLMMNVALFYVAARGITTFFVWNSSYFSKTQKWIVAFLIYSLYICWNAMVFISRLYIQAHFIHQCILGVLGGLFVGHLAWSSSRLLKLKKVSAVAIAIFLLVSSVMTYYLLLSQGMNPLWTVSLALKHCSRPEYVKVDTQPYYLIMRFTGAALGLGLGISSEQRKTAVQSRISWIHTLLGVKGGILIGRMAAIIQTSLPKDDMIVFLMLSFSLNIALPLVIIALLPQFLSAMCPA
ncbi:glucose-6-phosphatase 2-like [Penaeus japonicus]|uniref:glucose-6-phosphatase 2-like n=1 Tax=Penaeus japonicus TaxID=27405 RepID=UPI001C70D4A1|nr:glucose-6-phosphatase 2-like [Penaeus japonicus]XP_042880673.1 glucose-6-phosphatase 2-like [Penaeus japonicus]